MDDIYKKTSVKNRISLFSGTIIYLSKIILNQTDEYKISKNMEYSNKRQKIMVDLDDLSIENELKEFNKYNIFIFSISNDFKEKIMPHIKDFSAELCFYEMVSELIKLEDKIQILNTYDLKYLEKQDVEKEEDFFLKNSIYVAKQNGLDDELFVSALEILNNINQKVKISQKNDIISKYLHLMKTNNLLLKGFDSLTNLNKFILEISKIY